MAVLLTPIGKTARAELDRRKKITGSPFATRLADEDLLFMYGKTPWIKMTSNAAFDNTKSDPGWYSISSKWFGTAGQDSFSSAYNNDELKPRPGITGLSSTIKGKLGVMREINVKFKAYTLSQLETLQELFMIPGIGVLVEWGWSVTDASVGINLRGITSAVGDNKWLKTTVKTAVDAGKGRYDALFGLVCNFNITFVDDGTWDCETTIVGPGAMTVDINLKSPSNALDEKFVTYLEGKINEEMAKKDAGHVMKCAAFRGIEQNMSLVVSPSAQQKAKTDTNAAGGSKPPAAVTSQTNLYVTWQFVEDSLNSFFKNIARMNFAGGDFIKSTVPIKNGNIIPVNSFTGDGYIWRSFSPTEVLILTHPASLKATDAILNTGAARGFDVPDAKGTGDLSSVWLNWNTAVKPAFEGSETIQESINSMLNKLNNAAGGIWDLQLMYDDNFASYRVVDFKNSFNSEKQADAYVFNLNVRDSFIRAAEVSMVIPNALKATVMIASNAPVGLTYSDVADRDKVGVFQSLSNGIRDRFAIAAEALADTTKVPFANAKPSPSPGQQSVTNLSTPAVADPARIAADAEKNAAATAAKTKSDMITQIRSKGWDVELTGDEKSAAINYIFDSFEKDTNKLISALIPLELTITLDGVAGLMWGNAFTVSYLPNKYVKNAMFQIRDISHDVSSEGWTTKITGLMRPKYKGLAKSQPSSELSVPDSEVVRETAASAAEALGPLGVTVSAPQKSLDNGR